MKSILGFILSGGYIFIILIGIYGAKGGEFGRDFSRDLGLIIFGWPWSFLVDSQSHIVLWMFILLNAVILYLLGLGLATLFHKIIG